MKAVSFDAVISIERSKPMIVHFAQQAKIPRYSATIDT